MSDTLTIRLRNLFAPDAAAAVRESTATARKAYQAARERRLEVHRVADAVDTVRRENHLAQRWQAALVGGADHDGRPD